MNSMLTFDDVLIVPKFSNIESRKDVDLSQDFPHYKLTLPIVSSNMDTVTGSEMAKAMSNAGGVGCLHRFCSIEENVKMFNESQPSKYMASYPMVSIGLGNNELERAEALIEAGADIFVIDVAHGASVAVANQAKALKKMLLKNGLPEGSILVGNFATGESVKTFLEYSGSIIDGFKVGIGPGSACTTRIKTGIGIPQLSAVMDIANILKNTNIRVIADGGMKKPGDIAKALGAGADLIMLGGMLAGTDETPGDIVGHSYYLQKDITQTDLKLFWDNSYKESDGRLTKEYYEEMATKDFTPKGKKYRGSASSESYQVQGKIGKHRTSEGESFLVPYKGPVANILQDIEGGLRSAMTYVGAKTLYEFHNKCEFVKVTNATQLENSSHGKK